MDDVPYRLIEWSDGSRTVVDVESGGAIAPDSEEFEVYCTWVGAGGEAPIEPQG